MRIGGFEGHNLYQGCSYRYKDPYFYIDGKVNKSVSKTTYSKGTTQYPNVTGTNSSEYPSNQRHTDGYWYVYKGVQ